SDRPMKNVPLIQTQDAPTRRERDQIVPRLIIGRLDLDPPLLARCKCNGRLRRRSRRWAGCSLGLGFRAVLLRTQNPPPHTLTCLGLVRHLSRPRLVYAASCNDENVSRCPSTK